MTDGTAYETKRQLADKRMGHLKRERANIDPLWRELRDAFMPHRGRFTRDEEKQHKRITLLNETPIFASRTLASGLHAGLTSPARPWQKSAIRDDDLAEYGPVKEWLAECDRRMMSWYAKSNLYQALPFLYGEYGTFGTMAGLVVEDDRTLFRVEPFTVGQYALARSDRGEYDTLGRDFTMTVRQCVTRFGKERVSPEVLRMWINTSQRENPVEIMHLVEPDGTGGWDSCYYEARCHTGDALLKRAKFSESPILAASWEYVGNEPYASNCPGMTSRGAARALQIDEKDKSRAIQRAHNPPMQGPAVHGGVSLTPGAYNEIGLAQTQHQGIRSVYEFKPDIAGLLDNIGRRERRINTAYFVDLFLMLTLDERAQRATAEEIRAKYDEKVLALGPTLEQANAMLRVLHARVFGIMVRRSQPIWAGVLAGEPLLPPPPENLLEQDIEPEFISALQQAQRAQQLQGIERFASFAGAMAQFLGKPPEKFDADQAMDEYAAGLAVAPTIVRDDEEVAAMRAAVQQAERMQQMAAMAPAVKDMAGALKDAGGAVPQEGSVLGGVGGALSNALGGV